jgi:hypothetical protein
MCDNEFRRTKIDALILDSTESLWFSGQWNEAALTEFAVAYLSLTERTSSTISGQLRGQTPTASPAVKLDPESLRANAKARVSG